MIQLSNYVKNNDGKKSEELTLNILHNRNKMGNKS